jgi:glycosyltransferase involved in cell wall biosynthesis
MAAPRLMLLHALAPPTPGGTPVVLERLLTNLPGVAVDVVTDRSLRALVRAGGPGVLDARYRFVRKWPGWGGRWRFGRLVIAAIDAVLALIAGVRAARWARQDRVRWVLSVTDEGFSVIAGAVAARLAGVPHVVMVFDLWEENAYTDVQRAVAARLEPRIFRGAAAVVGYCPQIVEHYRDKYGIEAVDIPTPVDPGGEPVQGVPAVDDGSREVLLAGAVYWAQRDAVARLLSLRGRIPGLRMVTIGGEETLRHSGLRPDRSEPTMPGTELRRRLGLADVLFLGLSLSSEHPAIVRTATPARLVEYMASGRPVLVHAPAGSHVAEYARREDFAEVVDDADPEALLAGLRRVLEDPEVSARRATRARSLAVERHDAVKVGAAFGRILDGLHVDRDRPG